MADKQVLVTGANGFIGSHVAEALVERGYRVRCMVRETSDPTFIENLDVELAYADVRDEEALAKTCRGLDVVVHCAALTRALDEETFVRVNAGGAVAVARACMAANPRLERFLYVSSATAVGPSLHADDLVDETTEPHPVTWYGKSKLAAERALWALAASPTAPERERALPLTVVRPVAVFGPRDRDLFTYFRLVKLGVSLQLGRQERRVALIYVRDLVALILAALEDENAVGETYLATDGHFSYNDLSNSIARTLGKKPLHIVLPEAVVGPIALWSKIQSAITRKVPLLNDQRVVDLGHPYWLCSGEKARLELGFVAQSELDSAVEETTRWYQEHGWL